MRRYIYKSLFICLFSGTLLTLGSCKKFLDKEPATDVDPTSFYRNFYNFQGFTEELYNCIPVMDKREYNNMWNWGEEEVNSPNGKNELLARMDRGDFWISTGYFLDGPHNSGGDRWNHFLWSSSWYGIRKANQGLANLSKLTNATQEEKDLIAGQLYFFRAWFHFELACYWGGMPYIDTELAPDVTPQLPRLKWQEMADKIAADFKKAADLLPVKWDDTEAGKATSGYNELRINKIMAMAYLGKTYLYAGSPLMNKVSKGAATYDLDYTKKAAEAFGDVLKMVENNQTQYKLVNFSQYSEILRTNGQNGKMPGLTEAIFRGPAYNGPDGTAWSLDKQYLCARILFDRSWSLYPSANYANYFGMANGLPINNDNSSSTADAESGYDPQYPWKNRDPRFYLTYAFDTQRMVLGNLGANEGWRYANLATYGGTDEERRWSYRVPETGSPTGYLLIKFDPVGFNKFDNQFVSHHIHIPWMRLADIYLMYAEAVAIGYGSPSSSSTSFAGYTALDAVDRIRERATVGKFAPKFRTSTAAFMPELQRERAVELAWEGHRFHDLRRWLLWDKYPYNIKTAIEFDRAEKVNFNKVDPKANKVLNIRDVVIIDRKYTDKHYWLPIKRTDVNIYPGFPQNPGW
ncbi:RagB/SusD family nutrient uptake outer membrane protein [Mucilaginibacter auburnensis]|uniref:Putative outer membrane starch-binding protein n=1 Tax=Mucilaginibacter auburnensis TaxID=1457233 RepID=A0A2H9VLP6_9SPHI|nr:RagB/SusD family nutrient uptake outer membrane protein [Mucilaginibacter auburnensis]PJJ79243.1 putative outer membrane starch-binding protein [Mucilaginibacter auburnensis]